MKYYTGRTVMTFKRKTIVTSALIGVIGLTACQPTVGWNPLPGDDTPDEDHGEVVCGEPAVFGDTIVPPNCWWEGEVSKECGEPAVFPDGTVVEPNCWPR